MRIDCSSRAARLARRSVVPVLALFAAAMLPAGSGLAAIGNWVEADHVRARLIIGGPAEASATSSTTQAAALEIELEAGWKTYWRNPGEGGIPPRFDFSGSRNLAGHEVHYPAPERHDDGFAVSNVYQRRVVLPIDLRPADPRQAVRLQLTLEIGVCEKVCIPVQMKLALDGGKTTDPKAMAIVDEARRLLPMPAVKGVFAVNSITRAGGTDELPEYDFTATIPKGAEPVVFVDGPVDWFPGVPKLTKQEGNVSTFHLKIDRLGSKVPIRGAALRVTIVAGDRRMEQQLALD